METVVIKTGQIMKDGIVFRAMELLAGQFDQFFESVDVAVLEKRIPHHGAERRGQRHGETEGDSIPNQSLHHVQQGQVSFGDGFVEPILLEKFRVFRVPDERKVGVQDRGYISEGHKGGGKPQDRPKGSCNGGWGVGSTPGVVSVRRRKDSRAERFSSPSGAVAWMGMWKRPSGKVKW